MSSLIWGILLVLLGIELISKALFGFSLPIFRLALGGMIIYFGIQVIVGAKYHKKNIHFSKQTVQVTDILEKSYNIAFGEGIIDLSQLSLDEPKKVGIKTSFGSGMIILNPSLPTKIIVEAIFANANFPDGNSTTFGQYTYTTGPKGEEPLLTIRAKVAFGNLDIKLP